MLEAFKKSLSSQTDQFIKDNLSNREGAKSLTGGEAITIKKRRELIQEESDKRSGVEDKQIEDRQRKIQSINDDIAKARIANAIK